VAVKAKRFAMPSYDSHCPLTKGAPKLGAACQHAGLGRDRCSPSSATKKGRQRVQRSRPTTFTEPPDPSKNLQSMLVARDDLIDIDRIGCTSHTRRGALRARRTGRRKWWHLHGAWLEAIVTVQHALDLRVSCFDVRLISGLSGLQ